MVNTIRLSTELFDEDVKKMEGKFLTKAHFQGEPLRDEDIDVYKPDGTVLLKLRRKALPARLNRYVYDDLVKAARPTSNRGMAAGGGRYRPLKKDGTRSRTVYAKQVLSGVVGFLDRSSREPHCRATAFTGQESARWARIAALAQEVNAVFADTLPERYAAQMAMVGQTRPDWIIPGTAFSTVTVNRNFRTAVHTDEGDLPEGFGVITADRRGPYEGGVLVFPKYEIAVDLHPGDVLLCDVHEFHGNTAFAGFDGEYERLSCVFYYRREMIKCGSFDQELTRLRNQPRVASSPI